MLVFKPGDLIYHSKVLTFYRKENFALHAEYAEPANIPVSDPKIGVCVCVCVVIGVENWPISKCSHFYKRLAWPLINIFVFLGTFLVKNVVPTAEGEASKVKVKVRMNIHGIFFLKSATMIEKIKPEEVEPSTVEPPTVELPTVESMDTTGAPPTEGVADVDMTTPPAPNEDGEKMDTPQEATDQGSSEESSPNLDKKTVSNWIVNTELSMETFL